jgi:peptide-methionine (R)-S-oxide reductase
MKSLAFFIILAGCSSVWAQADPAKPVADTGSSSQTPSSGSRDDTTKPADGDKKVNDKKAGDKKASDKKASDKKASDKKASDKKASDRDGSDRDVSVLPADESGRVEKTEQEWKKLLTREQYRVLREKGTERPFTNKYDRHFKAGKYVCAACGQELFTSDAKFNSGCGWPAFYAAQAGDRVVLSPDLTLGMVRTEVTCARCGSHLGHVFDDAPQTPTGQRFCINSVSLKFIPAESKDEADAKPPAKDAKKSKAKKSEDKAP